MNHLIPADLASLQTHLDATRVKPGLGEKVLDNSSGQFSSRLILFEDYGNVGSNRPFCFGIGARCRASIWDSTSWAARMGRRMNS